MNPEVNQNSPLDPESQKIGEAEQSLISDLSSSKKSVVKNACKAIQSLVKRGFDTSDIALVALPELVQILISTEDKQVRTEARKTLVALDPGLKSASLEFVDQLEAGINKKINESGIVLFSGNYRSGTIPYAEHILIAGRIITESFMKDRFSRLGQTSEATLRFNKMALEGGLGNRIIQESPDKLSMFRPTLPMELRQLQNNLDSLFELNMLQRPVTIIKLSGRKALDRELGLEKDRSLRDSLMRTVGPDNDRIIPSAASGYSKSDFLCKELAAVVSYEKASIIVKELGEVGEQRATQAIKQASMGFMNSRGFALQFPSAEYSMAFKNLCEESIRKINARESLKKRRSSE